MEGRCAAVVVTASLPKLPPKAVHEGGRRLGDDSEARVMMTRRRSNIRRVGPSPWKLVIGVSGPITLPVEFDPEQRCRSLVRF